MRLIKLLAFAALGFVIYELYQGMSEGASSIDHDGGGSGAAQRRGGLRDALNQDQGRMRMTGPGRGELLTTEDDTGARTTHTVGRGVV